MFLKWRKGKPYVYKSVRAGGRVTSEYKGAYAKLILSGRVQPPAFEFSGSTYEQREMLNRINYNVKAHRKLVKRGIADRYKPYSPRIYYEALLRSYGINPVIKLV